MTMFDQRGWKVGTVITDPNTEIARLQADLRAALDIAEASARQCAKLRSACETALAIAEWREAGDFDTVMRLMRAALAPEEPPA